MLSVSEACRGDEELRREVGSLLELNHSPVLVDEPAWHALVELLTDTTQLTPGTQLGPYRLEAMLGAQYQFVRSIDDIDIYERAV